jgi:amino acid adenylation domain-containing protein
LNSIVQFLSDLRALGVLLSLDGDRLICNAPKGAVTEEIRKGLAERKAEIMAFLHGSAPPDAVAGKGGAILDLPLSRSQQRLWLVTQLDPANPVYNMVVGLRLAGDLHRDALERALAFLVERHESLRTSFYERDGELFAKIGDIGPWNTAFYDLTYLPSESAEDEAKRMAHQEARKPFALESGPLFRATLWRTAADSHLLLLVLHHIVADGWSLGILAREVGVTYSALVKGRHPALDAIAFQYRDYVRWEHETAAKVADRQMPFWLDRLSGPLPILDLALDRLRPGMQTFAGKRIAIEIEPQLAEGIRDLARKTGATPYMLLLAAFKILLARYTGLEDILVGSGTSNRQLEQVAPLVGFFVNNLVMRTDLSGNPSFLELIARVKETAVSAYAHQDVPFDRLVEELHPDRGLSHNPLVQVIFTLQNVPMQSIVLPGLKVEVEPLDPGIARADVSVEVWPSGDGFRCDFEYNTDILNESTIRAMQSHYRNLLSAAIAEPSLPIMHLPLLSPQERRQLLIEWNGTEIPKVMHTSVPAWFRAQARETPHATAVMMGAQHRTYAELDAQSDRLAELLKSHGAAPETVVGIYLQRSVEMIVGLLAILKAGGAYLPIDPALPRQRMEYLLSDAAVQLILTHSGLLDTLPQSGVPMLPIDQIDLTVQTESIIPIDCRSEDLAYLIYTSGSTGNPKGTEITHGALVNLLSSMLREPGLSAKDTLVAVTTLSFDIAGLEIFGPLVCGATLVLASREQVIDPGSLANLLVDSDATVLQATPSTWGMLVESGWMGNANLRMWCGGEALPPELAESLLARGRELWNLYGPTETTIWSAVHRVKSGENPILIGRPINNTRMYILSADGQPLPAGVVGELYIAGDGVARGYWRRPELTSERFLPDPFDWSAGRRMYRTGDLAKFRQDGQIQLMGRADQQIKLRGHRMEPGEIEAAIEQHPEVRQAVVTLQGAGATSRLIAHVKLSQREIDPADLRSWLRERLPEYMIPSEFLSLAEIPLTPNSKVDRKKLMQSAAGTRESSPASMSPRNRVEEQLASIWSDVLRRDRVGVRDNFFDLGGHSLLLIRVHARIRKELDQDIAVVDLFRYPTIESMASWLEQRRLKLAVAAEVHS